LCSLTWSDFLSVMAEAPAVDETLIPDDAGKILVELLPAQNKSRMLGLALNLPPHKVEAIHSQYQNPQDRLYYVIIAFLEREPRPTWRVIVKALRSRAVNLPALAKKMESAHYPDLTLTRDVVPETTTVTTDTESATNTTAGDVVKPKPSSHISTVPDSSAVEEKINGFHTRFISITESTVECLEICRIAVVRVVFFLTSVLGVGKHKKYLEENIKNLKKSKDNWDLFSKLNFYWNPLSYSLLQGLLKNLTSKNKEFEEINKEIVEYDKDMKKFRETTTLVLFCQVAPDLLALGKADPPPGFSTIVTEHQWPDTVTLSDVEEFRKKFLHNSELPECAMIVNEITRKCFEITWFAVLPPIVIQSLRESPPVTLFEDFKVVSLDIDGEHIYRNTFSQLMSSTRLFGKNVTKLLDNIAKKVRPLKDKKELKEIPDVEEAFNAINSVAHKAFTFVDKINDLFQHGRDTLNECRDEGDTEPLKKLLKILKSDIDKAEEEYVSFERSFKDAQRSFSMARNSCKQEVENSNRNRNLSRDVGHSATVAAVAGVIVLAVVAGVLTGGVGAVPVAIAGAAAVGFLTAETLAMLLKAEKTFNELTDIFSDSLLYALSTIKDDVDTVRKQVINIFERYQAENEATGHVLDHQQKIFSQYAKETSAYVESLKKKSEQIDEIVSSLFNA
jgi:hypothetical protein